MRQNHGGSLKLRPHTSNQSEVSIALQQAYLVPQFYQGGSSGVPAMPATILMSV
jgi:hypothetical protein